MKLLQFLKSLFSSQTYSQPQQLTLTTASKNVDCYRVQRYNPRKLLNSSQSPGSESQISLKTYRYRGVPYVKIHYHNVPELLNSSQFPESEPQISVTIFKYRRVPYT